MTISKTYHTCLLATVDLNQKKQRFIKYKLFYRKSSVNHSNRSGSSSSSSNNSIETKTRNPPKKFQRLALENVLLGPVQLKKHSESFPTNFHSVSPEHISSESSVGDPIFYYIKSSLDCPCAYHDQVYKLLLHYLNLDFSHVWGPYVALRM